MPYHLCGKRDPQASKQFGDDPCMLQLQKHWLGEQSVFYAGFNGWGCNNVTLTEYWVKAFFWSSNPSHSGHSRLFVCPGISPGADLLIPLLCILYDGWLVWVYLSQDLTAHAVFWTCLGDFLGQLYPYLQPRFIQSTWLPGQYSSRPLLFSRQQPNWITQSSCSDTPLLKNLVF